MDALLCVHPCLSRLRSACVHVAWPRAALRAPGLLHAPSVQCFRLSTVNGSRKFSSPKDDANESSFDAEAECGNFGGERFVNSEKCGKDELSASPSCIPSKEVLLRLWRYAELSRRFDDVAEPRTHQLSADLQVHESEVPVPSWAATALTFAIAFAAGVVVAQFRGSFLARTKHAVVDVRVAPSAIASTPYPEQEAPESDLKAVLADGSVKLRTVAADSFLRMQDAARQEGIWLIPISGFRSVSSQRRLFFDVKAERMQAVTERAKVSAPPGYSEHHTGYAIDIGDLTDPNTYLEAEYEEGDGYRWLQQNAARFHFELSFPKDNSQGIMYEPWHWRFVGDEHSLHTFYAQHKLYESFSGCKI